jgi:hypothetical protein
LKNNEENSLKIVGSMGSKLANRINKNLTLLSTQFSDEFRNNVNIIINNTRYPLKYGADGEIFTRFGPNLDPLKGKVQRVAALNEKFNLSFSDLKITQNSNALNIIKLINHNLIPSLGQTKIKGKTLSVIKETLKAYGYRINNNTENALTGIISSTDNVNKFKLLGTFLSKMFKKNIELQLVKLHNVGLEETILAKIISENARFDKSSVLLKKI